MKTFKYFALLGILAASLSSCEDKDPVIADIQLPDSQPFLNGTNNYAVYRIPSMVITKHDVVLAFCEGRVDGREDNGNIDVVLRRSGDRGQTWQELISVYDDGTATCHNQCPVYIPEINRVVLIMNRNYTNGQILVSYSDNEGQTWSAPRDITAEVKPQGYIRLNQGPCHGIVKQLEPNKGRLLVAGYMRQKNDSPFQANVIYSDDNGETWHLGGIVPSIDTNESSLCELSDGSLMMNMRIQPDTYSGARGQSISKDGGMTWSPMVQVDALPDPRCQGSIFTYGYGTGNDGKNILLFSNPTNTENRNHNTLRASLDDGATWTKGYDYTGDEIGGYSDIAAFSDGEIAVLSEYGHKNKDGIFFRKFKLDDLK